MRCLKYTASADGGAGHCPRERRCAGLGGRAGTPRHGAASAPSSCRPPEAPTLRPSARCSVCCPFLSRFLPARRLPALTAAPGAAPRRPPGTRFHAGLSAPRSLAATEPRSAFCFHAWERRGGSGTPRPGSGSGSSRSDGASHGEARGHGGAGGERGGAERGRAELSPPTSPCVRAGRRRRNHLFFFFLFFFLKPPTTLARSRQQMVDPARGCGGDSEGMRQPRSARP